MTEFQVEAIHFGFTIFAAIMTAIAIRIMMKSDRQSLKLQAARVGDTVKFLMQCETDDCIMTGKIAEIKGKVVTIEITQRCGYGDCNECLGTKARIDKDYRDVIF